MSWNYRVTRRGDQLPEYEIREVYYGEDGSLSWTERPSAPYGIDSLDDLKRDHAQMMDAFDLPILDITDENNPYEVEEEEVTPSAEKDAPRERFYAWDAPTLERAAEHGCLDEDVDTGDPLVCGECCPCPPTFGECECPIPPAACACGHPSNDHDDEGACMHLCDCAWPIPPEGMHDESD